MSALLNFSLMESTPSLWVPVNRFDEARHERDGSLIPFLVVSLVIGALVAVYRRLHHGRSAEGGLGESWAIGMAITLVLPIVAIPFVLIYFWGKAIGEGEYGIVLVGLAIVGPLFLGDFAEWLWNKFRCPKQTDESES